MSTIISPHLDDACLSLGQMMTVEPCHVVTVFAGSPSDDSCSDYDRACGFETSRQAMVVRRREDEEACKILGATTMHLDFTDGQYGRTPEDERTITNAMVRNLTPFAFVPLGLGHPDHELVARCCLAAAEIMRSYTLFVYEELPYRVIGPEKVPAALDRIRQRGWAMAEFPLQPPIEYSESGDRALKEQALAAYASQIPGALDPCFLVPERCWRISIW